MLTFPKLDSGLILGQPRAEFKNYENNYFFIKLTRVNIQLHLWLRPCLELTPKSVFKTMIIIIFIFTLS
jgi:hypothetical protein